MADKDNKNTANKPHQSDTKGAAAASTGETLSGDTSAPSEQQGGAGGEPMARVTSGSPTPATPGAPAHPNVLDPMLAPQADASPERFLSERPAHIAALGNDAPPLPAGVRAQQEAVSGPPGTRPFRLHKHGGWFDGTTNHPAGSVVHLTQEQFQKLRPLNILRPYDPRLAAMDDDEDLPEDSLELTKGEPVRTTRR